MQVFFILKYKDKPSFKIKNFFKSSKNLELFQVKSVLKHSNLKIALKSLFQGIDQNSLLGFLVILVFKPKILFFVISIFGKKNIIVFDNMEYKCKFNIIKFTLFNFLSIDFLHLKIE